MRDTATAIRYGVIGIKGIGRYHIGLAQRTKNVELTAIVDVDTPALKATARALGVRGFTDYRDMLDAGLVDAVSIATPHDLHGIIGLACLQAGVHVFVEKPLANRVSEADAMLEAARAKRVKICVAHQYRMFRASQAMKHLIDQGRLGNILRVLWTWGEFRSESYYEQTPWRATWRHAGGGVLMNQASHDLDLLCWMVGRPVQVSALLGSQLHQAEIEDVVCANVRFDNGAVAALQFTVNQPQAYSIRQIAGERAMLVIPDVQSLSGERHERILLGTYEDDLIAMVTRRKGVAEQPAIQWRRLKLSHDRTIARTFLRPSSFWRRLGLLDTKPTGHTVLMQNFIKAIYTGEEPLVSGESARSAVELINAIVLSAMRKKTVELPLDRAEYDWLFEELSYGKTQISKWR